ncbi:hypothetical protein RFI_16322, partial [Reticulomyxa filosa]
VNTPQTLYNDKHFLLQYDLVFELILTLLDRRKNAATGRMRKEELFGTTDESFFIKKDEVDSDSESNSESDSDNEIEHKSDDDNEKNKSVSQTPTILPLTHKFYSKQFFQCLVARVCENDKHQLAIVHIIGENNIAASEKLCQCIIYRIDNLECFDCYSAVTCFIELISIDDECKQKRWDKCLKPFIQCISKPNNAQSWNMVEMCVVLLLDLIHKRKDLFEWFAKCKEGNEFFDWIKVYAKTYPSGKRLNQNSEQGAPKLYKNQVPQGVNKYIPIGEISFYKDKSNFRAAVESVLSPQQK